MLSAAYLQELNKSRPWLVTAAAFIFGALMPLAYAPFHLPLLAPVLLAGLLLCLYKVPAKVAALRGFLFGLGMFGFGVSWVYNSLHDYGNAHVIVAVVIAAALICIMAAYIAAMAYVLNRWFAVTGFWFLAFPCLWVLVEWFRGWFLTGFPWLFLAYAQTDTLFAAYAPIGGECLVAFVVCSCASGLALIVCGNRKQQLFGVAAIVFFSAAGLLTKKISWTEALGQPLKVAIVQGDVPIGTKMAKGKLNFSLDRYSELTAPVLNRDLIVWPETAIPTFASYAQPFLDELESLLYESNTQLLSGIFTWDRQQGYFYNTLIKLGDESRQVYKKQRLVPFGEYMPLRGVLKFMNRYIDIPMADLMPGANSGIMQLAGYSVALGICYESAYSSVYRAQLPEGAYLINVSNDAWFGNSLAPHQHLQISRFRSLESGREMLRATNNGISAIITADGELRQRSPQFATSVLAGVLQPHSGATPFIGLGPAPTLSLCLLLLSGICFYQSHRQREIS